MKKEKEAVSKVVIANAVKQSKKIHLLTIRQIASVVPPSQ
jgi:hypothetical protein